MKFDSETIKCALFNIIPQFVPYLQEEGNNSSIEYQYSDPKRKPTNRFGHSQKCLVIHFKHVRLFLHLNFRKMEKNVNINLSLSVILRINRWRALNISSCEIVI